MSWRLIDQVVALNLHVMEGYAEEVGVLLPMTLQKLMGLSLVCMVEVGPRLEMTDRYHCQCGTVKGYVWPNTYAGDISSRRLLFWGIGERLFCIRNDHCQ